jgi:Domain of unknown function (DUF5703)/Glycosyl hydrolase family 95 catalytic domain
VCQTVVLEASASIRRQILPCEANVSNIRAEMQNSSIQRESSSLNRWLSFARHGILAASAFLLACRPEVLAAAYPSAELARYDVIWDSPSQNAAGAMPLGNGEVGLNLWVEPNGDLVFYMARTDDWSECCRLLKLGRVRVSLSPNPFANAKSLRQELKLREGQVVISAGDTTLRVFVDANAPVIYVVVRSRTPRAVTATWETWRTTRHVLAGQELESSWTMHEAPAFIKVWESADVVTNCAPDAVLAYHRNAYSVVPLTLKQQSLETLAGLIADPLRNRTFGARMAGRDFVADGPNILHSARPLTKCALTIATHTAQTATAAEWERQLPQPVRPERAARRTAAWWRAFWGRSWIFVEPNGKPGKEEGDSTVPSRVTQAYVLQRWMTACAGRGNYPIKFNGSIFTVDPRFAGGPDFSPDWRRWGDCYWWQNSRLPYFAMAARGDSDEVQTLFRLYERVLPLCEARAKLYHGVAGAYFPETMTIFGTYANADYGWNRQGRKPNEVRCPYWHYAWQQGLELTAMMLDYYDYTQDKQFLTGQLIPMANAVLRYYDTRFQRDPSGKLIISPTQAVETYWYGVTNDTPSVAGLTDVCARLLKLPAPEADRAFWQRMQAATPPLPISGGCIQPAAHFEPRRSNVENPELYALWPFRLYGVGRPDLALGVKTFQDRREKASIGWQYDGQCAAIVGLADEAGRILLGKVRNSNPNFRFPAMWGPNYDWLPDQDHGANIMLTLQNMVVQADGDKIYVLPAWPADWNVSFKLRAPKNTIVEGVYRNGKLQGLKVTPGSRRKDVVIGP